MTANARRAVRAVAFKTWSPVSTSAIDVGIKNQQRPKIMMINPKQRERTGRVDLRLHPENKAKLERIASAKRRTVTSIIDEIIEDMPEPEEQRK